MAGWLGGRGRGSPCAPAPPACLAFVSTITLSRSEGSLDLRPGNSKTLGNESGGPTSLGAPCGRGRNGAAPRTWMELGAVGAAVLARRPTSSRLGALKIGSQRHLAPAAPPHVSLPTLSAHIGANSRPTTEKLHRRAARSAERGSPRSSLRNKRSALGFEHPPAPLVARKATAKSPEICRCLADFKAHLSSSAQVCWTSHKCRSICPNFAELKSHLATRNQAAIAPRSFRRTFLGKHSILVTSVGSQDQGAGGANLHPHASRKRPSQNGSSNGPRSGLLPAPPGSTCNIAKERLRQTPRNFS